MLCSLLNAAQLPVSRAIEQSELCSVVLDKGCALRDGDEGDAQGCSLLVQMLLHIYTGGVGALIQYCELGAVVEQSSHAQALLLTCRQQ